MTLPYENSTSGERALDDIRKVLSAFGCAQFGTMTDTDTSEIMVQFKYRGRQVLVKASWKGYAAAWLKEHPYNSSRHRKSKVEYERQSVNIGQIAVYSILRDWIKGQITAIETGVMQFEGAFLGQILLPSGKTVVEEVAARNLLPAPSEA
jgi:hypothetical protein